MVHGIRIYFAHDAEEHENSEPKDINIILAEVMEGLIQKKGASENE